jgi:hypothetical protein
MVPASALSLLSPTLPTDGLDAGLSEAISVPDRDV